VLALIAVIILLLPIVSALQATMWIVLIPFAACFTASLLYFLKSGNRSTGIIALVTVPIQVIIFWSLIFNKFIVGYARPEFRIISLVFTIHEAIILIEAFVLE